MDILNMSCGSPIGQFTVTVPGLYAWRLIGRFGHCGSWIFGECVIGDKIDGQFEGCGPIVFFTTPSTITEK